MRIQQNRIRGRGRGLILALAPSILLMLSAAPTYADGSDGIDDKFSVSIGAFFTDRDTVTRLDGDVPDSGTDVDLESTLGFDKSDTVFRIDGYYRIAEKHRVDFSWFDLSRKGSKQIDEDFEWDGEIYPVDVLIDAALDLSIYKLAYTYSFMQREQGFLGVTLGVYVADIGTTIGAESIGQASSRGTTAPLPVIGLRGQYDFAEKWSLRGSAEFFAIDYGDYSGSLNDLYAGVDYQFAKHAAVGLGINSVRLDVGVDKTNFNGNLDWRYDGGLLYFKFDF